MRIQKVDSAEGLGFVIAGAPPGTASPLRSDSRFGPNTIRSILAMVKPNNVIMQVNITDGLKSGNVGDFSATPGYIHPTYRATEEGVAGILKENTCPIILGGDRSTMLVELHAVAKKYGPAVLVYPDSHFDLYDKVFGQEYNHGTLFRRALGENLIDASHSIQVGIRRPLYNPDEYKITTELGVKLIPAHKVGEMRLKMLAKTTLEWVGDEPYFLTSDIDFIDPVYAPGTDTPEVRGFTPLGALELVQSIKDLNFAGFDLAEILSAYDHGKTTAYLVANIVFKYLSILTMKKKAK